MARQKSTHVDSAKAVGQRIRDLRIAAGLLQRDLSFPGCTPAYISRVEVGARIPSLQLLEELGQRLGVSAEFLARGGAPKRDQLALADAQLAQRLGRSEEARLAFAQLVESSDSSVKKAAHLSLGQIALSSGDPEGAIGHLETYESLPPKTIDAAAVEALTDAYWLRGERAKALTFLQERLDSTREDPITAFRISVFLANALIDSARFDEAVRVLSEAEGLLGAAPDPIALARLLWAESRMQVARGASDAAARYAEEALAIIKGTEHAEYAARARQLIAFIELERGNANRALDLLEEAAPLIEMAGDRPAAAKFRVERARALAATGRNEEARELAESLVRETEELAPVDAARALAVLAKVLADSGDPERAIGLYEAAANALADLEEAPMLVNVYTEWSDLLAEAGRTEEAFSVARRALGSRVGAKNPT
jgi:tetratricopeptide (TPR) repeat protein